jgi:hypothetical protein
LSASTRPGLNDAGMRLTAVGAEPDAGCAPCANPPDRGKGPDNAGWRPCLTVLAPGILKGMKETVMNTGPGPAVIRNDDGPDVVVVPRDSGDSR